ncbi:MULTISPECIES: helix-turn-helix transcriptional regulator [Cobetia]|uniref:helix-turn-helix domain-containing protein n=1 Tax=Cobetia TaxID=204286 RepID=UPI0015843D75|nr:MULTISPECIES: helix-turn-helix transcriptional regulator [Cobetia]MDI4659573.1 helix-turn-helix domain-containing protein [Cobetia sp. BMC6]NUJ56122.1 helix-turn-helix transcriptional regulator [Cobetia marina]
MEKHKAKLLGQVLGSQLRQERNRAGLTQDDIAVAIGVDRRHYARIESGQKRISIIRLIEVCEALNIAPSDVISNTKRILDHENRN